MLCVEWFFLLLMKTPIAMLFPLDWGMLIELEDGRQVDVCVHGVCKPFVNGSCECFCQNGFTGYKCETDFDDCVSEPCRNGATCIDQVAGVICTCPEGYSGIACETIVNHCHSRPCLNGGLCQDLENGFACLCNVGFTGQNCEVDIEVCNSVVDLQEVQCFNGGTCVEGVGISFTCSCPHGFKGPRCEEDIDECLSQPCLNNGTCVDGLDGFICICSYKYKGLLCEEEQSVCSSELCSHRGLCLGNETHHKCFCVPDYHGFKCQWQYNECLPEPRCLNGGTCIDDVDTFTCLCPSDFIGQRCESRRCNVLCDTQGESATLSTLISHSCSVTSESLRGGITTVSLLLSEVNNNVTTTLIDTFISAQLSSSSLITSAGITMSITNFGTLFTTLSKMVSSDDVHLVSSNVPFLLFSSAPESLEVVELSASIVSDEEEDERVTATTTLILATSMIVFEKSFLLSSVTNVIDSSSSFAHLTPIDVLSSFSWWPNSLSNDNNASVELFATVSNILEYETGLKILSVVNNTISDIVLQSSFIFIDSSTLFSSSSSSSSSSSIEFAQHFTTTATFSPIIATPIKTLSSSVLLMTESFDTSYFWTVSVSDSLPDTTITAASPLKHSSQESLEGFSIISSDPNIPKTQFIITDKTISAHETATTENILKTWNEDTILLTSNYEHFVSFLSDIEFSDTIKEMQTFMLTPSEELFTSSPLMTITTTTTTILRSSSILETTWDEGTMMQTPELLTRVFSVTSKDITSDASATTIKPDKFYPFSSLIISQSTTVGLMPSFTLKTVDIVMLSLETVGISSHQIYKSSDGSDIDYYETSSSSSSLLSSLPYKSNHIVESTIDFSEEFGSGAGGTLIVSNDYWVSSFPSIQIRSLAVAPTTALVSNIIPNYDEISYFDSFSSVMTDDQLSDSFDTFDSIYWPIVISDLEGTGTLHMPSSILIPTLTISPPPSPLPSSVTLHSMSSHIVSLTTEVNQGVGPYSLECSGVICLNGGTCHSYESPKGNTIFSCLCLLNFTGVYCDKVLPKIDIPAFSGLSWLSYDLFNGSSGHSTDRIQIRLTFKTVANTGILFHVDFSKLSYNCVDTFLLLQLENGFPILSFSCGSQSVVSMEEMIRVDDGQEHIVFVGIEWYMYVDHRGVCNISMQLDHWPSITGQQHDVRPSCFATKLYIGRSSHSIRNRNEFIERDGFRGCVLKLQVNGQFLNLISDAFDGASIGNCDNLLCTVVNCHHGGTCKILEDFDAVCSCPSGYCGQFCERKTCVHKHCRNGGTCLFVNYNDYVCLCPYGYNGLNCEQVSEISEVAFFGSFMGYSSFIAYQFNQSQMNLFSIKLEFSVSDLQNLNDGLLIFIGQRGIHFWNSTFFAVGLHKGSITLQYNIGLGMQVLTSKILERNELYFASFGIDHHLVWLQTNDEPIISCPLQWPVLLKRHVLVITSMLYIGGHESYNFTFLPDVLLFQSGFSGCVSDIKINTGNMSGYRFLEKPIYGRNVKQCDTNNCNRNRCHNGGTCKDLGATFMCECPSGWLGPLCNYSLRPCEKGTNKCSPWSTCVIQDEISVCDCPLGWEGTYCDRAINITDASFNGINSFASFMPQNIRYFMNVRMEIQAHHHDGVLFYAARYLNKRSDDFLCISLNDGYVEFRYNYGRSSLETTVLRSPYKITVHDDDDDDDSGSWHVIHVGRKENRGFLEIDSKYRVTATSSSGMVLMDITTDFYLGGLPDMSSISPMATAKVPTSFNGCIRYLAVNDRHYNIGVDAKTGRNVIDCDGTACGHEVCVNGGTCVPLGNHNYRCVCGPLYTGSHCVDVLPCHVHLCQNGANCIPPYNSDDDPYICECPLGWKGQHCNQVEKISSAYFKGDGYIVIVDDIYTTSDRSKTRISFIFRSLTHNGLLVWTGKEHNNDEDFLGIGLQNGQLKVIWNLGLVSRGFLTTFKNQTLVDSRWHNATILRQENKFTLDVDGTVYVYNTPGSYNYYELNTLGVYYLGGLPRNVNVSSWTNGHFHERYTGCLKNVTLSTSKPNVNFMDAYSGYNVLECLP